jgi:hypothetical protein
MNRTRIERFIAGGAYPFMLPLLKGFVQRHDLALGLLGDPSALLRFLSFGARHR